MLRAAWGVLKYRFAQLQEWFHAPYACMVRLVKLNEPRVASELDVRRTVTQWCDDEQDTTAVAGHASLR